MPEPEEPPLIKAECGSLCQIWQRAQNVLGLSNGVGAPTMSNALPNLDANEADKMRDRAAQGQAPVNIKGMDTAAQAVQRRQQLLREI